MRNLMMLIIFSLYSLSSSVSEAYLSCSSSWKLLPAFNLIHSLRLTMVWKISEHTVLIPPLSPFTFSLSLSLSHPDHD